VLSYWLVRVLLSHQCCVPCSTQLQQAVTDHTAMPTVLHHIPTGKDGYILLARPSATSPPSAADDAGGECGILMDATYPVLASSVAPVVQALVPAVAPAVAAAAVAPVSEAVVLYEETQPQDVLVVDSAVPAHDAAESALLRLALSLWRGPYGAAAASDCTGGGSTIVFQDISIEPETPARGKPVKMAARGVLTKVCVMYIVLSVYSNAQCC
jgi:hypothetical protein